MEMPQSCVPRPQYVSGYPPPDIDDREYQSLVFNCQYSELEMPMMNPNLNKAFITDHPQKVCQLHIPFQFLSQTEKLESRYFEGRFSLKFSIFLDSFVPYICPVSLQ